MKRGVATFTLDWGKCPTWLYERMVRLGREMVYVLVDELGPVEFVRRIADPVWFQSLGTVLAFDWNASGLTTIMTAALKEAIRGQEKALGIYIAGGKGKTSRKTPEELVTWGERLSLNEAEVKNFVYNSKMSAKVDSALVQDNYQIYHHSFFFSAKQGKVTSWAVVQQGMDTSTVTARRYHWFSEDVHDLVCEPHSGIVSQNISQNALNMTSVKSSKNRKVSAELAGVSFDSVKRDIEIIRKYVTKTSSMIALSDNRDELVLSKLSDVDFRHHPVEGEDFWKSPYLSKILEKVCEVKPKSYEDFLALEGVGPKTVRALALVSEIIYGADASWEDPARYSFAHGGKDSIPYPVDLETYDQTIGMMRKAVARSQISISDKNKALSRLPLPPVV